MSLDLGHMRAFVRRVHFVGIGGVGMSGIAEVLANLGYRVSGSDLKESAITRRLKAAGVRVSLGHGAANVRDAQVVVVSSAVQPDNLSMEMLFFDSVAEFKMFGERQAGALHPAPPKRS